MRTSLCQSLAAAALALVLGAGAAQAAIIFSDDFDAERRGVGALNYTGFANWTVTAGSVDLIGNGFFDFFPDSGLFVDLNGSTRRLGTLATKTAFAPGAYRLSFDFAGTQRGHDGIVTVRFGDLTETIRLASRVGLTQYSFDVEVTGAPQVLSFVSGSTDNANIGGILDNVVVATRALPVPEPAALLLLGAGLAGLAFARRRRHH